MPCWSLYLSSKQSLPVWSTSDLLPRTISVVGQLEGLSTQASPERMGTPSAGRCGLRQILCDAASTCAVSSSDAIIRSENLTGLGASALPIRRSRNARPKRPENSSRTFSSFAESCERDQLSGLPKIVAVKRLPHSSKRIYE